MSRRAFAPTRQSAGAGRAATRAATRAPRLSRARTRSNASPRDDVVDDVGDADAARVDAFEPRVDARATTSALVIGAAFFVVNRRVAAAVAKRRAREEVEEEKRRVALERLRGGASIDDETEIDERLRRAYEEEAKSREVFFGLFRVRMPQPLGKPLSEVEAEEARVAEASGRRRNGSDDARAGREGMAETPPWWMTTVSAIVLVLLTWSSVGLGSVDRVAEAPRLTPDEIERFRAGGGGGGGGGA